MFVIYSFSLSDTFLLSLKASFISSIVITFFLKPSSKSAAEYAISSAASNKNANGCLLAFPISSSKAVPTSVNILFAISFSD